VISKRKKVARAKEKDVGKKSTQKKGEKTLVVQAGEKNSSKTATKKKMVTKRKREKKNWREKGKHGQRKGMGRSGSNQTVVQGTYGGRKGGSSVSTGDAAKKGEETGIIVRLLR